MRYCEYCAGPVSDDAPDPPDYLDWTRLCRKDLVRFTGQKVEDLGREVRGAAGPFGGPVTTRQKASELRGVLDDLEALTEEAMVRA